MPSSTPVRREMVQLSEPDAALLDFLRQRGKSSELSPDETLRKTLALMAEKGRFEALLKVADILPRESGRILGAVGTQLGKSEKLLRAVRIAQSTVTI